MKGYLPPSDWEQFQDLFEKTEHSTYLDTRDQALTLLDKLDPNLALRARQNKETITNILTLALAKVP